VNDLVGRTDPPSPNLTEADQKTDQTH